MIRRNLVHWGAVHEAMMRLTLMLILGTALLAACVAATPPTPTLSPTTSPATAVPTKGHLPNVDWPAYHDATVGFVIQHPLTWQRSQGEGYPVVFTLQAAPGTTLLNKTMEIIVTPEAKVCNEGTYLSDTGSTSPQPVTVNGVQFLKENGSGIGLGNIYDWTGYSTLKGTTCITITFVLHSANAGVFGTEPAPFDKAAESQIFDQLLNTFKFDQRSRARGKGASKMTWAVIFSIAVMVTVVVGFVISRRQRDNAWKQLATEVGGEFISGGAFRSSQVRARVQQWVLTLDTYTLSAGDSSTTFTRLRSPLQNKDGLQFKLFREGLIGKLDKAFGGQDIEIGVPDFDDAFVIQGNDQTRLQALLTDVKIRQLIQAQRSITLSLKGEELRFEAQGVIKDVPRLKSLCELFRELLNHLEA